MVTPTQGIAFGDETSGTYGTTYLAASNTFFNYTQGGTLAFSVPAAGVTHGPLVTPASSSATCTTGDREADASYVYVCTATNTWKRAALSSF